MARITRRHFLGTAAASVAAAGMGSLIPRQAAAADIKIGALFPLSGPMALLGEEQFRGVEIAREMVNEKGGVLGGQIVYAKADAPDATAATA